MNSGMRWMSLAVVALVSTSAWAVFPDTDANLVFNMNFEVYDNGAHTTTSAKPAPPNALVGTVIDYNTNYPDLFGETGRAGLGTDGNFAEMHDNAPGGAVHSDIPSPNDCKLSVPSGAGIFDLGYAASKHTWTFWFNVPNLEGTILRHASLYLTDEDYKDKVWEIRIFGGTLQFYHKNNSLCMQTASTLSELGVDVNNWHHAAVVIDRTNSIESMVPTTQLSTKIYIDGLEAPVIVTALNTGITMKVDYANDPLWIGAGEREFDGLLDDVRLFNRVLTPLEVSLLNQPPDNNIPIALLPIPRSSNVLTTTDVTWIPAANATAQGFYFGTDVNNLVLKAGVATDKRTNADLGGPFPFNIQYYWYVKSTITGVGDVNGPLWSFTTETGKAYNPSPYDGAEDIDNNDVNLVWTTASAATYSVYLSTDISLVEANSTDPNVHIADGISVMQVNDVNTKSRGAIYYWRVNSTYTTGSVPGDIWSFRTKPYELIFNTSGLVITYADHAIPEYNCVAHKDGWSEDPCANGSLASDGVVVFNFPNGFNYDKRYDIIVVPKYGAQDVNEVRFPTPLAIHVTGNFSFDGRVQIAGDDILTTGQDETFARSGGFPGPKHNQDISIFPTNPATVSDYWTAYTVPVAHRRLNGPSSSAQSLYVPTALAQSTFGPGIPVEAPYKDGGGGGSGGAGGDSGRGWEFGLFSGGPSYGDKEVPVPFGGSAGGWGGDQSPGGAAGGGGIEIAATGNILFDSNSQINANGGGQLCPSVKLGAGGGGGGCVRIIAGGSVALKGSINVNGGKGGNNNANKSNDTGGGGGGGRVAIFYGTTSTYSHTGTIDVNGGAKGMNNFTSPTIPNPTSLAQNGQNGTIFDTNGSPKKASAPMPANGDEMVYCHPDPCNIQLKWYSGYGGGTDVAYWGTTSTPVTQLGDPVSATRGQHSSTVTLSVSAGQTYYWKVVTDGAVSSDIWSFKTVNWRCRQYEYDVNDPNKHVAGPEWDSNRDCVLNLDDFWFFAKDWYNPVYYPAMDVAALGRFASEWMDCINRTDNGCAGW